MTPKPVALRVQPDNIPAVLKFRSQWVVWRYEWKSQRWTKPPYYAIGRYADSTDPKTWRTFQDALAVYLCPEQGWDGIGFVHLPEDGLVAGDADDCRDPVTGTITGGDAVSLLELDTYTEVSPSGTGIRTYAFGKKPGRSCKKGDFELYDGLTAKGEPGGRFLTVTGHRLDIAPATINERQDSIDAVYYRYWPKQPDPEPRVSSPPPSASETELLALMFASKNGAKIRALYDGDLSAYSGDESAADLALCSHLSFWFCKDANAIEQAFNGSSLGARAKWRERPDYRSRTISKAIQSTGETYTPRGPRVTFGESQTHTETQSQGSSTAQTGAEIILAYFRQQYSSEFRSGNSVVTRQGEVITKTVACGTPDSDVLKCLESASDAPRFKGGGVNRNALPGFFRNWAPVAWGDFLKPLASEYQSQSPVARDHFRRSVRDAMLGQHVLGNLEGSRLNQTEKRSLIHWCQKFAKLGPWRSIRSLSCWTRCSAVGGQIELHVAIRQELFAQIKADRRLIEMNQNMFSRLAMTHGVGTSAREDRVHGKSAVVLTPEFLAELIVPDREPTGSVTEPNLVDQENQIHSEGADQIFDRAWAS